MFGPSNKAALHWQQKPLYEVQAEVYQTCFWSSLFCSAAILSALSHWFTPCKMPSCSLWWPSLFLPEIGLAPKNMAYNWNALRDLVVARFTFFHNHRGNFLRKSTLPKGPGSFWDSDKMDIATPGFPCISLNTYCQPHSPLLTHFQWLFL